MSNGAQALIATLVACDVQVCFANPGTSEMHFVAALDSVPQMRGVLCLFEGVVTGAADQQCRGLTAAQHVGDLDHGLPVRGGGRNRLEGTGRFGTVVPGDVGRQDQVGDARRAGHRRRHRFGGIATDVGARAGPANPAVGPTGQWLDVGFQRRVVFLVVGGVVADDVDHRDVRAPGVVQVGQTVAQPGAQMQQGRRQNKLSDLPQQFRQ